MIYTYGELRAKLVGVSKAEKDRVKTQEIKEKPKTLHDKIKRFRVNGPKIDSSKLIREMRNEE